MNPATVLMVEDSPTQAARLMHLLQSHNYGVVVATNGKDAIALAKREKPSLIVSDVTMPDMDGYDMCRAVRAETSTRSIPVLLLTGLSDPEDIINGLDAGADCYLTKPYEEQDLLHRIDFVLKNRAGLVARENPVEIEFMGKTHRISSSRHQILGLLLSTYESAASQNKRTRKELLNLKMQQRQADGQKSIAQQSLRNLAGLLDALARSSSEPVFLFNDEKNLVWKNVAAEDQLQDQLKQVLQDLSEKLPPKDGEPIEAQGKGPFWSTTLVLENNKKVYLLRRGLKMTDSYLGSLLQS